MQGFEISSDGTTTFFLRGELDMATVPSFESAIATAVARGGPITLDMDGLSFIDSTGLHALVRALKALPSGCVILHGVHGPVERAIELVGIEQAANLHIIPCSLTEEPVG
jgi:anti-sigma B factor antagonist